MFSTSIFLYIWTNASYVEQMLKFSLEANSVAGNVQSFSLCRCISSSSFLFWQKKFCSVFYCSSHVPAYRLEPIRTDSTFWLLCCLFLTRCGMLTRPCSTLLAHHLAQNKAENLDFYGGKKYLIDKDRVINNKRKSCLFVFVLSSTLTMLANSWSLTVCVFRHMQPTAAPQPTEWRTQHPGKKFSSWFPDGGRSCWRHHGGRGKRLLLEENSTGTTKMSQKEYETKSNDLLDFIYSQSTYSVWNLCLFRGTPSVQ